MLQPRIGDTIIIEGTVTRVEPGGLFQFKTPGRGTCFELMDVGRIKEIIKRPIGIGSTVRHGNYKYKVIAFHGTENQWTVCARDDDHIPLTFTTAILECVD